MFKGKMLRCVFVCVAVCECLSACVCVFKLNLRRNDFNKKLRLLAAVTASLQQCSLAQRLTWLTWLIWLIVFIIVYLLDLCNNNNNNKTIVINVS